MFRLLMNYARRRRLLPQISPTERQALTAGATWIDRDFFSGQLDWMQLTQQPYNALTSEEQAFIDGPCHELLGMFDPWEVAQSRKIPEPVMKFINEAGFMGLIIPKEYGGKGFSRLAVSTIMHMLSPRSMTVATVVIIANSLSAAELILHYGTEEQKNHYLPLLAQGQYVPCFALTELESGSDAASIKAEAIVFRDPVDEKLKLRLNFEKRFMTLGPIANLATLACVVRDPQNLLKRRPSNAIDDSLGITCVLVHKGTPGFTSGRHHLPIGTPFENGPLSGDNVVVPIENVIGGEPQIGNGWRMLMEQLAGGRAISLPAGGVGATKLATAAAAAYSMVRWQFGRAIGRMEGVEDEVGRMAAISYLSEAARIAVCSVIDGGLHPPVVSGVLKTYTTKLCGDVTSACMDVFAGAGVIEGPNNIPAPLYAGAPVGKTVEGAFIMGRTFLTLGQGAVRSHPYALALVEAIENNDVQAFRKTCLRWVGHCLMGAARLALLELTRGHAVRVPERVKRAAPETVRYYQLLSWSAARFGVLADLALIFIGGRLKKTGKLNGRYADVFAWMLLGYCGLLRFQSEGFRTADLPLVDHGLQIAMAEAQRAFEGIFANFKSPSLKKFMRTLGLFCVRLNPLSLGPDDELTGRSARLMQSYGKQYERLSAGVYFPDESQPAMGRLLKAFRLVTAIEPTLTLIRRAQKSQLLPAKMSPFDLADQALRLGVITPSQSAAVKEARSASLAACAVDVFDAQDYYVEAISTQPAS